MSEKAPAFQFYPKDYQTDGKVRLMSWEARGVYLDLLCTYWLEGSLPSDPSLLADMVGMTRRRFVKLWPKIAPCFGLDGERLTQKRLDRERSKQRAYSESQSEKGKKGGKPKGISGEVKPEVIYDESQPEAEAIPKQSFPFASSPAAPAIQSPSSPSVDSRSADDDARSDLMAALSTLQASAEFRGMEAQAILNLPRFCAASGPVRLAGNPPDGLLRATAGKLRAYGRPTPAKLNGVPAWDRGADHAVSDEEATVWDPRLGPRPEGVRV